MTTPSKPPVARPEAPSPGDLRVRPLCLSRADFDAIVAAIAEPPESSDALQRAFERHRALAGRVEP